MDLDAQRRQLVMALEIVCVPALSDNYVWLVHDPASGETLAVDPGDAAPVLAAAEAHGWRIDQLWITHWHGDHTGGIAAIKDATGCRVSGPKAEAARIPTLDVQLSEGDRVRLGAIDAEVWQVPGHTAGHIAFVIEGERVIFPGDTLFAMGCGRLFEGTAADMWPNMQRFAALPPETKVYGAHEYTLANARFARAIEPDNADVIARQAEVEAMRARGEPTLPTTVAAELATNPFVRAGSVEEFARRRAAKDSFKG